VSHTLEQTSLVIAKQTSLTFVCTNAHKRQHPNAVFI